MGALAIEPQEAVRIDAVVAVLPRDVYGLIIDIYAGREISDSQSVLRSRAIPGHYINCTYPVESTGAISFLLWNTKVLWSAERQLEECLLSGCCWKSSLAERQ